MRVSKEPEERKQEILNAAIEVFAKKDMKKHLFLILHKLLMLHKGCVTGIFRLRKSYLMQH